MLTLLTGIVLSIIPRSAPHQSMQQMIDSGHTLYISDSAYCRWKKLIAADILFTGGRYIKQLKNNDIITTSNKCKRIIKSTKVLRTKDYNMSYFTWNYLYLQTCSNPWRTIITKAVLIK